MSPGLGPTLAHYRGSQAPGSLSFSLQPQRLSASLALVLKLFVYRRAPGGWTTYKTGVSKPAHLSSQACLVVQ